MTHSKKKNSQAEKNICRNIIIQHSNTILNFPGDLLCSLFAMKPINMTLFLSSSSDWNVEAELFNKKRVLNFF